MSVVNQAVEDYASGRRIPDLFGPTSNRQLLGEDCDRRMVQLGYRQVYRNYDMAIPMGTFEASVATGMVIAAVGLFLVSVGALAVLLCFHPAAPGAVKCAARAVLGPDALLFAALACAVGAAFLTLQDALVWAFPAQALVSLGNPQEIVSPFPSWPAIAGAVQNVLHMLVALALIAYAGLEWIRRRWLAVAAGTLAVAGLVPGSVHTPGEFLLYYAVRLAGCLPFATCSHAATCSLTLWRPGRWPWAQRPRNCSPTPISGCKRMAGQWCRCCCFW